MSPMTVLVWLRVTSSVTTVSTVALLIMYVTNSVRIVSVTTRLDQVPCASSSYDSVTGLKAAIAQPVHSRVRVLLLGVRDVVMLFGLMAVVKLEYGGRRGVYLLMNGVCGVVDNDSCRLMEVVMMITDGDKGYPTSGMLDDARMLSSDVVL